MMLLFKSYFSSVLIGDKCTYKIIENSRNNYPINLITKTFPRILFLKYEFMKYFPEYNCSATRVSCGCGGQRVNPAILSLSLSHPLAPLHKRLTAKPAGKFVGHGV